MSTHREFLTQLRTAIGIAVALNIDWPSIVDEALVIHNELSGGPGEQLIVHADGYHAVPGCPYPCVTPIPLLLGMSLSQHQIDVIRTNIGCDAMGEWMKDGVPIPGFGLGFEGPTGGVPSPISWKNATNAIRDPEDAARLLPGSIKPFPFCVRRIRARTLAEAAELWAKDPFPTKGAA
jgi:hypothetical protein